MKCLLINPPTTNMVKSTVPNFIDHALDDNPSPPLGLMYIAAYAEKHCPDWQISILDMVAEKVDQAELSIRLCLCEPDVVGITVTTLTLFDAIECAKTVKRINPTIMVAAGGSHCSIYPAEMAAFDCIDFVFAGDGEESFAALLNAKSPPPIYVKAKPIEDLDSLPFPARHLIDGDLYRTTLSKAKMTSMITSRGCPYNCIFCCQEHHGKKWRARSSWSVVEEMITCGAEEIEIYDDTFTADKHRVIQICNGLFRSYFPHHFNIRTRVDRVDPELLKALAQAGCTRINYGIESMNNEVLRTLNKRQTVEQIKQAVQWTKDAGIEVQAYLMLGSPYETAEQMKETICEVTKLEPDYVYYSITSPIPGSRLYQMGLEEHRYEDYWLKFARNPVPNFVTPFWADNRDEVLALAEHGYRSFYGRPKYMAKQLLKIRSFSELKRKAKVALEMFR